MKRSMPVVGATVLALAFSACAQQNVEPSSVAAAAAVPSADPGFTTVLLTPIARDGTPVGEERPVQLAPVRDDEHRTSPEIER